METPTVLPTKLTEREKAIFQQMGIERKIENSAAHHLTFSNLGYLFFGVLIMEAKNGEKHFRIGCKLRLG